MWLWGAEVEGIEEVMERRSKKRGDQMKQSLALCVSGGIGAHEQRRGTCYLGFNRTPLAVLVRGKSREPVRRLLQLSRQEMMEWPWSSAGHGTREETKPSTFSPALGRGLRCYFERDSRTFASPQSSAG